MQRRPFLLAALAAASLLSACGRTTASDAGANRSAAHDAGASTAANHTPANLAAATATTGEATVDVKHRIEIETPPGKVLAKLTVENHGKTTIWIPHEIALEKELTGRRFDVRDFGGKPLDYTGRMVKRAALTAADYVPVEPGKTLTNTIDITRTYAFVPGRHNYNIGYAGPVLLDIKRLDAQTEFPARPVSFTYTAE